ncbi:MAG: 2'-5' RNA ligase [Lachnospiraceae bacterium]|nr:2'-5' RNA ligase [Lachnospiraceae bacterium]
MAYTAFVTKLNNFHKDPNSDRLYLADCFGEGVIVGESMYDGELVLYLPEDGQIDRWVGDKFNLFRKNSDGTPQGGYLENNGHIRAIKLRGNKSSGIAIALDRVYEIFGDQKWKDGDRVTKINGDEFCRKYIPHSKKRGPSGKKSGYKGKKVQDFIYPEFEMHKDTEQLVYNFADFKPGDIVNLSLKMHGTSTRHMRTYVECPKGFFRKLFHLKPKTKPAYVCGTRRCIVTENSDGYYGNDAFRLKHHKELELFVEDGMEVYGEIVGYYGPSESDTIMPIADNSKINDKTFIKEFGKRTIFNYGCEVGESKLYIYRITSNNGQKEWTPEEIVAWCDLHGLNHVPYIDTFVYKDKDDLLDRINTYFEDLHDPVGKTHVKEGVVVRILNRPTWKAYKMKTYEFRVLEGLVKENSEQADMEEAQEEVLS